MDLQFVDNYINKKLDINENFIRITYYDIKVKNNLSNAEEFEFLNMAKKRLKSLGFLVYFTGAKYTYCNANMTVQDNELLIAIKQENDGKGKQ